MDVELRQELRELDRKWSLHPFASGWRLVDVAIRVAAAIVVVYLALSLNLRLDAAHDQGSTQLASHSRFLEEIKKNGGATTVDAEQMYLNYLNLHSSADRLFAEEIRDRRLHVLVLLAFVAFLGVSAIVGYKTHTELAKLKSGFQFLFTYEGRKWLDREAPREDAGGETTT